MTVTSGRLADFVVDRRMLVTTALALPIGALSAAAAWGLLKLIGLVTNLVFYHDGPMASWRRERSTTRGG
jgi:chloride channel protein, CIC family